MKLRNSIYALAIMCTAFSAAFALEKPEVSKLDRRVQYTQFKQGQVYPVNAVNGVITTIVFAPDEKVLDFGSGYSTAWEFQARGNHFFLKPKAFNGTTNLVVVTDKHTYLFEVRLVQNRPSATYSLTFSYPAEEAAKAQREAQKKVVDSLLDDKEPISGITEEKEKFNWNYTENFGSSYLSKEIAPLEVYDNGLFTFLKFERQTDFPAVYRVADDEEETLLNSHVKGDWLVIHGVYKELRLRAGKAVVGIYNEAFTGGRRVDSTGVTLPGVQRELIRKAD